MIDSSSNVLDSREIIDRLEELQSDRSEIAELGEIELNRWNETHGEEMAMLEDLDNEGRQYSSDWEYGETLVNAGYWTEYVKELLADCGDLPKTIPSYVVIDWEATADNIKADYTELDFDGETFYIR